MNKYYNIIVATDNKNGFSKDNKIPWYISKDFKNFKIITTSTPKPELKNDMIMGRVTFETLDRPLDDRINIVITSNPEMIKINNPKNTALYFCNSLKDAELLIDKLTNVHHIFIIGGERIYKEALDTLHINTIYRTFIDREYNCDRFFPKISEEVFLLETRTKMFVHNDFSYNFECWKNKSAYKNKNFFQ